MKKYKYTKEAFTERNCGFCEKQLTPDEVVLCEFCMESSKRGYFDEDEM